MEKINKVDSYQLSPMQQGMLFDYLMTGGSGVDIQQMVCEFEEQLNVPMFKSAWEVVVNRHAVLRTGFKWADLETPRQEVYGSVPLPFEFSDWRDRSGKEQQDQLEAYLINDRRKGFNLENPPVFRLMLIQMGERKYTFIWTNHHIIHDGRTRFIIFKEVFAYYESFLEGKQINPDLPRPYRDYIQWLEQKDYSESEVYFKELLRDSTTISLAFGQQVDQKIDSSPTGKGEKEIKLSAELTTALKEMAGKNSISLSTVVHGAWGILLGVYSGEEEVIFGEVRACRRSALSSAESMIGLFMNNLPMRVKLSHDSLLSYLKEIRKQQIALRAHEHTPLAKLHEWGGIRGGKKLFESFVLYDNLFINSALQAQGENWKKRRFKLKEEAVFPLVLYAWGEPELVLKIAFDRKRFDDSTIARMCGHLQTLLKSFPEGIEKPLSDLTYLTQNETDQLLIEWNSTSTEYPREMGIHRLFEQQAEKAPDKIAVVCGNKRISYEELNNRSNQMAKVLRSLGVRQEVLVGIYLERSEAILVAMLGILKAGGAYVPLDPEFPRERISYMIENSDVEVILTQGSLKNDLMDINARTICLDDDWHTIAREKPENLNIRNEAENLAYVIYTSGSTGKPKGVQVLQGSVINFLVSMSQAPGISETDTMLAVTTLSFDISVLELLLPLIVGAKIVIASRETALDGARLSEELNSSGATIMQATPSTYKLLMVAGWKGSPTLKVLCGGESMPKDLVPELLQRAGSVWNMYGPTETTVWSTCYRISEPEARIFVGRPINNTQIYICNKSLQPVPVGVTGEMLIGGDGVARGYLNRQDLTEKLFIPNPFGNGRVYKTGDLARYAPNGNIEVLGRGDQQIKLRGYRIETEEIENALLRYPAISQAVVVLREDEPGDKRLVAYMICANNKPPVTTEIRNHLREILPDYMIPSIFVTLETLPLTPNKKIDRRALPIPDQKRPELSQSYVAPKSALERELAESWCKLLKLERIGVNDSFFELGGNSMLLIRVVSELQRIANVAIPVVKLFQYPTIEALANYANMNNAGQPCLDDIGERSLRRKAAVSKKKRETRLNY